MQDSNWTLEDRKLRTSLHRACIHYLLSDLPSDVKEALLKTNIVIGWHYRYQRYVVLHAVTLEEAEYLADYHEVIISKLQNLLRTFRFAIAEGYPGETRGILVKCIRGTEDQ